MRAFRDGPLKGAAALLAACLLLAAGVAVGAPAPAGAQPTEPLSQTRSEAAGGRPALQRPFRYRLSERRVIAIARGEDKIARELRKFPGATSEATRKGFGRWQVSFFSRPEPGEERREVAQVIVDDATGAVVEAWTGHQVAWSMARGYPGAFGRRSNALYIWIPLCVLFVAPFITPRRPLRWLHLDLLVLVSFSISFAFFNHGRIDWSVPLVYPPLVYLLVRMILVARRPAAARGPLPLLVPASYLAGALIFLVGFRVALNVANSNVIDVGYSGVIGADKLADGEPLYGNWPDDNQHGDTYGPVNYYAYVPFEQAFPWGGKWADLSAAHAAAIFFDLLCMALLFLLGRRVRGPDLGIALAYGWATFPFTLLVLTSNANDALVAALVIAALLVAWAPGRGFFTALAGLTKFAPLGLGPLLALSAPTRRWRSALWFCVAFAVTAVVVMLPVLLDGDLRLFYDRTIGFQNERGSPFSIWGYRDHLDPIQTAVTIAGALFAFAVAFVPRRKDDVQLAALAAAVLIALQLGITHWFYLYIVWFFPPLLLALLARETGPRAPPEPPPPAPETQRRGPAPVPATAP